MPITYAVSTIGEGGASGSTSEIARLLELIITKIPLWIAAFVVLILSIFAAKVLRRVVENKMAERGIEEEYRELQILGGRMTYTVVLILGLTISLKVAGIDLTTIIAAVAFGIGFALRDLIMNFLAGIMILSGRHFIIGDFIKVGGTIGKVVEIQSRVTILQAIDGTKVIMPNAELLSKEVISLTSNPFRRIEVALKVDYQSDLQNVMRVCMKAAKQTKKILIEPKPAVVVDGFDDVGVNIIIRAWVESRSGWIKIKSELAENIKAELQAHKIISPWPTQVAIKGEERDLSEIIAKEEEKAGLESLPPADIRGDQPLKPLDETAI